MVASVAIYWQYFEITITTGERSVSGKASFAILSFTCIMATRWTE